MKLAAALMAVMSVVRADVAKLKPRRASKGLAAAKVQMVESVSGGAVVAAPSVLTYNQSKLGRTR